MKIKVNNTKLLFLYRTFLFHFFIFETDVDDMKTIVKSLNIKNRKERIVYIFDETINILNKYYSKDLCQFIDGKCIVQREKNINRFNGCCRLCPIVTDKGCPSVNITCKLIYCKRALGNIKLLKLRDIKILKCLSLVQRLIILSDTFSVREEVIKDLYYGPLYAIPRGFFQEIKHFVYRMKYRDKL